MRKLYQGLYKVAARRSFRDTGPMLKNSNHFRFQLHLPNELAAMDNSSDSNLNALLEAAEDFIQQNTNSIDSLCKKLA